jgi:DNA-binding MarR family transcriptional regulator
MTVPDLRPAVIGGLLFQAHQLARAAANEAMRPYGIELRHLGVLSYIADNGPRSQRQLGSALGLDKSAMVRIVDELERQGLATRGRSPHDRRSYEILVTAEGLQRMQVASERASAAMDGMLATLTPDERCQLTDLLARFVGRARHVPSAWDTDDAGRERAASRGYRCSGRGNYPS